MPAATSVRARAVALILALGALAPAPARAGFLDYLKNRGLDLADVFGVRVSGAKKARGAGLMVRATCLAQVGAVYFDGEHAGMDRRAIGVWRERRLQGALGPLAMTRIETRTQSGNQFAYDSGPWAERDLRGIERNGEFWDDGRRHPLAIGAEVQPGILPGVEVRFDPLELVDFVIGFTTIDIYDDDMPSAKKRAKDAPAEGAEAAPSGDESLDLGAPEPLEGPGEALFAPGAADGFSLPPDRALEPEPAMRGDDLPRPSAGDRPGIQPPTLPPSKAATPVATPAATPAPIATPAPSGPPPPIVLPRVAATPAPIATPPPAASTPAPAVSPKAATPRATPVPVLKPKPAGPGLFPAEMIPTTKPTPGESKPAK